MGILSFQQLDKLREFTRQHLHSPLGRDALLQLLQHIHRERLVERHPLFVLGAGISADEVPLLWELSAHLIHKLDVALKSNNLTPEQRSILTTLKDLGGRVAEKKALRSDAAEFFFSLQGSAPPSVTGILQNIWRNFSVDLLSDRRIQKLRPGRTGAKERDRKKTTTAAVYYKAMTNASPTEAHRWVANEARRGDAWCLSFNFDRLTARALQQTEGPGGCAVLYRDYQIQNYFTAADSSRSLPAVFKVRGDVFYATCTEGGCSLNPNPIPLHALPGTYRDLGARGRGAEGEKSGDKAALPFDENESVGGLRCPECGVGDLVLQLSFPGFRAKEEEAFPVLEVISSFLHHRLSAIIVIGFSGHWDDYVLEFLSNVAARWEVPIVDVKPNALSDDNPVRDYVASFPEDVIYLPFEKTANAFAKDWADAMTAVAAGSSYGGPEGDSTRSYPFIGQDLEGDGLWLNRANGNRLEVQLGDEGNNTIKLDMSDLRNEYLGTLVPSAIKTRLSTSAQLAIDNMVIAGEPGTHDRWHHSLGAGAVGLVWYKRLADFLNLDGARRKNDELMLAVSLALHDYGHLPFSHLSEQVIEEINWRPRIHSQFGSEVNVLAGRLSAATHLEEKKVLAAFLSKFELKAALPRGGAVPVLLRLISGAYARPYLAAIVNSPVDADKIDYLIRDVYELGRRGDLGFQSRLPHQSCKEWLAEFLADQTVNGAGLLCLNGRSAMAARDLLEERMFLYRSLYRSPEVRGAERIAIEFVRQYAIARVWEEMAEDPSWMRGRIDGDLRSIKNLFLQKVLLSGYDTYSEEKEWKFLVDIVEWVLKRPKDSEYVKLLEACWSLMARMKEGRSLRFLRGLLRQGFLVGTPFYFQREDLHRLRRIIRPLQHQYCCDVLFDLVALPRYLSDPSALTLKLWGSRRSVCGCNILVPEGRAENWGYGAEAKVPLQEEAFDTGRASCCMVYVYDPFLGRRPQAFYAYDKFLALCKSEGIKPISEGSGKWIHE